MEDDNLNIFPPLYLIGMTIPCWKCQEKMPVVAILTQNIEDTEDDVCILLDIVGLPEDVLSYIQGRVQNFKLTYSKTAGCKYFANTCPSCDLLFGDFFLHSEPGAPFFPTNEHEASLLYLTEIPIQESIEVQASFHLGTGELILGNAKRIS